MAKKRKATTVKPKEDNHRPTLSDQLDGNVLAKLKSAKKDLEAVEQKKEEERLARLAYERKQREKNKSFEELLGEYGFDGKKFD
ncbi:YqkE family protein [Chungangia koreensis]|uniref:YqkE family protein n=1 Tax=Chungangia koreensis TaxID=752657 RepID=A0ABV8X515_9LACT